MAVMVCWKSGLISICRQVERPEATLMIAVGMPEKLRSEMVATARHDTTNNTWYVPGVQELTDEQEDAKFDLVDAYTKKLIARRYAKKGRVGMVVGGNHAP